MLEPYAPPAATPPAPRPASPAPQQPTAPPPTAPPTAKAPPAAAPQTDADAGEVDDADIDDLSFLDEAPEGAAEGQLEGEPARQTQEEREADRPADPGDYEIKVPGVEFGERDQEILGEFTQTAHELGLSNREANSLTEFVYKQAQQMHEHRLQLDKEDRAAVLQATAQLWGAEAPTNQSAVRQTLRGMSKELQRALRGARANGDPHGALLLHHPEFLNLLAQLGRRDAGAQRQVHDAGPPLYQIQADIDALGRLMKDDFDYYARHNLGAKLAELEAQKAALTPQAPAPRPLRGDAAREKEILKIMHTNYKKYEEDKLSAELAAIHQRRAGRS